MPMDDIVAWVIIHELAIKKMPHTHKHAHRPVDGGNSSPEVSSSQGLLVCQVKSTAGAKTSSTTCSLTLQFPYSLSFLQMMRCCVIW